jgi:hypothetical protein
MECKTLGDEVVTIRKTDRFRHKYGDAMAEYLDTCLDGPDDVVGDCDGPYGYYCGRYGKRLLFTDSFGFVSVDTFRSAGDALAVFDAIASADAIYWQLVDEGVEPIRSDVWCDADANITAVRDSVG